jgi:hypothetical protein
MKLTNQINPIHFSGGAMNAISSSNPMTKQWQENTRLKSLQSVWFKRKLVGLSVMGVPLAAIGATYQAIIMARDHHKLSPPRHW